jgi:hypothetical protein
MDRTELMLLGPFNGVTAWGGDDLRREGELNSRRRTCLVPPTARAVIADAVIADAVTARTPIGLT